MGVTRTNVTTVINETVGNANETVSGEDLQAITDIGLFLVHWFVYFFIAINLMAIFVCWRRGKSKHRPYKVLEVL